LKPSTTDTTRVLNREDEFSTASRYFQVSKVS
jgi:hypothetical protein